MRVKYATKPQRKYRRKADNRRSISPVKWLLLAVLTLLLLSAAFYYTSGGIGNFAGFKGLNQDNPVQAGPLAPFFRGGSDDQTTGTARINTGTTSTGTTRTSNGTTGTRSTTNETSREVIQSGTQTTPGANNGGLININDNSVPGIDDSQDIIPQDIIPDVNTGTIDNATKTLNDTLNQTPAGGVVNQVQNSVSDTVQSLGL